MSLSLTGQSRVMVYDAEKGAPGARALTQSLSLNSPVKSALSQRPYHGSMQKNGALRLGGDQIATTGASKVTVRYGLLSFLRKTILWT